MTGTPPRQAACVYRAPGCVAMHHSYGWPSTDCVTNMGSPHCHITCIMTISQIHHIATTSHLSRPCYATRLWHLRPLCLPFVYPQLHQPCLLCPLSCMSRTSGSTTTKGRSFPRECPSHACSPEADMSGGGGRVGTSFSIGRPMCPSAPGACRCGVLMRRWWQECDPLRHEPPDDVPLCREEGPTLILTPT